MSKVCDKVFDKTPVIKNELINRDKVSGVSVSASKELLEHMIKNGNELYFGIPKFPPSKSLYLSLFHKTKIHQIIDGESVLKQPSDTNGNLHKMWSEMITHLKDNSIAVFPLVNYLENGQNHLSVLKKVSFLF